MLGTSFFLLLLEVGADLCIRKPCGDKPMMEMEMLSRFTRETSQLHEVAQLLNESSSLRCTPDTTTHCVTDQLNIFCFSSSQDSNLKHQKYLPEKITHNKNLKRPFLRHSRPAKRLLVFISAKWGPFSD